MRHLILVIELARPFVRPSVHPDLHPNDPLNSDANPAAQLPTGLSDEVVFSNVFSKGLKSTGIIQNFLLNEKRHSSEAADAKQVADQIHPRLLTPEIRHLARRK